MVAYNGTTGISTLWFNPLDIGDNPTFSTDPILNASVTGLELQQRGQQTGDLLIDNLIVSTGVDGFNEAALVPEPGTFALLLLGSVAVFARRRHFKNVANH